MHEVVVENKSSRRVRVERGIYRQANGKYVVCFMLDGKPRFRTVGHDLELARAQRQPFVRAAQFGIVAAAPRLRLETGGELLRLRFSSDSIDKHWIPVSGKARTRSKAGSAARLPISRR
jgi:hypothetical protein